MPYRRTRDNVARLVLITATWGAGAAAVKYHDDELINARTKQERLHHQPWRGMDPDRAKPAGGRPDTTTLLKPQSEVDSRP